MELIPMSAPDIVEDDVRAVAEVVRSGRLALGPKAEEFERLMAQYVGVEHAVAVSSGTAALHLIVKALGIGAGDEVLVPSFTFVASANVILYEGATPVFVDIEPDTLNLDPDELERKVTPRTKAVMVVDVFGQPAEWDEILRVAEKYGLKVIDDACEALGAEYKGKKLGRFGEAAAFAFYPNKQMATGDGGVIVTNNPEIAGLCRSLRNQGRGEMDAWLEHERLGYNYRMTEMSAALGVSQLRRIEELLAKRARVAGRYRERLRDVKGVEIPYIAPTTTHMSWFVYVVRLDPEIDRNAVVAALQERGIPSRPYFPPIHLQPFYREMFGYKEGDFPITESVAKSTLALPFSGIMTEEQVEYVCKQLDTVVSQQRQGGRRSRGLLRLPEHGVATPVSEEERSSEIIAPQDKEAQA